MIIESSGIIKGLRFIINTMLKGIAKKKNKQFPILAHNYYIEFSIFYQKLRYNPL